MTVSKLSYRKLRSYAQACKDSRRTAINLNDSSIAAKAIRTYLPLIAEITFSNKFIDAQNLSIKHHE